MTRQLSASLPPRSAPTGAARLLLVGCGDHRTETLRAAGYLAERRDWIEYELLDRVDLLILAPAPPEPPAAALIWHLRQRSAVATLALITNCSDRDRSAVLEVGADDCLDAAVSDAYLLGRIEALLSRRAAPPPRAEDGVATSGELVAI